MLYQSCLVLCDLPLLRAKSWGCTLAGGRLKNCSWGWKHSLWLSQRGDGGYPVALVPSGVLLLCRQPPLFPCSSDSWVMGFSAP